MTSRHNVSIARMAPGMLTESFARRGRCTLALVRLAKQAAGAGRFRSLAFVMRHHALHGVIG